MDCTDLAPGAVENPRWPVSQHRNGSSGRTKAQTTAIPPSEEGDPQRLGLLFLFLFLVGYNLYLNHDQCLTMAVSVVGCVCVWSCVCGRVCVCVCESVCACNMYMRVCGSCGQRKRSGFVHLMECTVQTQ